MPDSYRFSSSIFSLIEAKCLLTEDSLICIASAMATMLAFRLRMEKIFSSSSLNAQFSI